MTTATAGREVTYLEAISQALDEEMTRDERVFLMGEDIGPYGGAFRITEGVQQKYGEWRGPDTPRSEARFVGGAPGAALLGPRPRGEPRADRLRAGARAPRLPRGL